MDLIKDYSDTNFYMAGRLFGILISSLILVSMIYLIFLKDNINYFLYAPTSAISLTIFYLIINKIIKDGKHKVAF